MLKFKPAYAQSLFTELTSFKSFFSKVSSF